MILTKFRKPPSFLNSTSFFQNLFFIWKKQDVAAKLDKLPIPWFLDRSLNLRIDTLVFEQKQIFSNIMSQLRTYDLFEDYNIFFQFFFLYFLLFSAQSCLLFGPAALLFSVVPKVVQNFALPVSSVFKNLFLFI